MAAKLTHSSAEIDELKNSEKRELDAILMEVMNMGHTSVVEHVSFTFALSDVSRSLTHQLVRHRIASYSQQSQRYVAQDMTYVIPPSVKKTGAVDKYHSIMKKIWELYGALQKEIPTEDARYVLPNASCTKIIVTMNARSLLNFFELRCCLHAQWEIRRLAWRMLGILRKIAPVIFHNTGPPCKTRNECPMKKKKCKWYPGN
jgi:thymidylate synthase (FAD)